MKVRRGGWGDPASMNTGSGCMGAGTVALPLAKTGLFAHCVVLFWREVYGEKWVRLVKMVEGVSRSPTAATGTALGGGPTFRCSTGKQGLCEGQKKRRGLCAESGRHCAVLIKEDEKCLGGRGSVWKVRTDEEVTRI